MYLAALVQQAGIAVAYGFGRDIQHFGNFVVAHLQPVAQAEKVFFGVGQAAKGIEQLPILDVLQAVGASK